MKKESVTTLKEALEKEKISLVQELKSFAKEDKNTKDNWATQHPNREKGDMEEEADEAQEYDTLISLEHNLELRLKDVNLALHKIGNGDYGICEQCKKEIAEERLEACPEAKLCMKCNK